IRQPPLARVQIRNYRDTVDGQAMAEPFVVPEKEQPIFLDWSAGACAELVTTKRSGRTFPAGYWIEIENVSSIECAVAQKLKHGSVQLICSRLRDGCYLRSGAFSIFGGIRSRLDVEFTHGIDTK